MREWALPEHSARDHVSRRAARVPRRKTDLILIAFESLRWNLAYLTLTDPKNPTAWTCRCCARCCVGKKQLRRPARCARVIVHGEGRSFCPASTSRRCGAALSAVAMYPQLFWPIAQPFPALEHGLSRPRVPVSLPFTGNCLGAGLQLALGADIRIATPDARLSRAGEQWGLVPDMAGPPLLRGVVRVRTSTNELTFTRTIPQRRRRHASAS